MNEKEKTQLNEKLSNIAASAIIHITEDVHGLGLDEEQQIRATSFVIEKMKRANDFANKKMGINPNL